MTRPEHRPLERLEAALPDILAAPAADGAIELIVRRPDTGEREVLEEARLDESVGLVGDNWSTRGSRSASDGSANPETQLTLMSSRAIACIAGEREHWPLAGDQLFVDLDLSAANLPPGTRLRVGSARIEISTIPHTGCAKFIERFGSDAQRFVNSRAGRERRLRGVNARVVTSGVVRTGDRIVRESPAD